jgi:arginase
MEMPTMPTDRSAAKLPFIDVIAMACGAGARDPRCKEGPAAFRKHFEQTPVSPGLGFVWHDMPADLCAPRLAPLEAVARTSQWTADITERLTLEGARFVALGGDHSLAIGTWSGAARALRRFGPLGLIWIDAHMDMHTAHTTHSGAINGMPVAAMLGHGAKVLTDIAGNSPALDPRHVCLIGARSFEPEELEFAKQLGVRVIHMDDVHRRGIGAALAEAKSIAMRGTAGYGVSLDLDAFDPVDAPGVGTAEPDGIRADAMREEWWALARDPMCIGIEIAEFNPARDEAGRTVRLMGDLIASWAERESLRWAG